MGVLVEPVQNVVVDSTGYADSSEAGHTAVVAYLADIVVEGIEEVGPEGLGSSYLMDPVSTGPKYDEV